MPKIRTDPIPSPEPTGFAARLRRWAASCFIFANMVGSSAWALAFLAKRDLNRHLAAQEGFARRNRAFLRIACNLEIVIEGTENLPPPPYVILSNHQSYVETITLPGLFPPFVWVLKESLVRVPVIGTGLRLAEPIAIDRAQPAAAMKKLLRDGGEKIQQGFNVMVFPEGTIKPVGEMGAFNPGGAALAKRAGVAIVPVAHNSGKFWPRHGKGLAAGTLTVTIGSPILPDEAATLSVSDLNHLAKERVAALLTEIDG